MKIKKMISLFTALCSCFLISVSTSVSAQTVNNETIELISHDYMTGEDTLSIFSSEGNSTYSSTQTTQAYIPNDMMTDSGISPNTIFYPDNRLMADVNVFPHSAVVCLEFAIDTDYDGIADSWGNGTGFVTSKNVVVTAAHCLYTEWGWVKECKVHYKQNDSYFNSNWCYPQGLSISSQYANSFDKSFDWGIMTLQDNIGYNTGWFAIGTTEGSLTGKMITVAGYPYDRPFYQYFATDSIYKSETYDCYFRADVVKGQSGGPVYDINNTVWAICTAQSTNDNRGARITRILYDLIASYY